MPSRWCWIGAATAPQLAAGLLEGQLRQATRDLILLRKARLELDRPADAARLWADLDGLSWRDLDDRELACCPSLLLVGDSASGGSLVGSAGASLGGVGLAELHRLLGADLPLRVLLLADLDLGLDLSLCADDAAGLPAAGLTMQASTWGCSRSRVATPTSPRAASPRQRIWRPRWPAPSAIAARRCCICMPRVRAVTALPPIAPWIAPAPRSGAGVAAVPL
jgi:hypothetical protein